MSIKSNIFDQRSGKVARVDEEHALQVSERFTPPFGVEDFIFPLRQFLTSDGEPDGPNDMRVDGSVTPVDFFIKAINGADRYINRLSIIIADQSATLNQFGAIGSLTNGMDFFYDSDRGQLTIAEALDTNFEFIRLAQGDPAFRGSGTAFVANNAIGTGGSASEAYLPSIDLASVFGTQFGIRLKADSIQKLTIRVNDDVTGVDAFNIQAFGFDRYDTRDAEEDSLGTQD
jgi:hypothetical protein